MKWSLLVSDILRNACWERSVRRGRGLAASTAPVDFAIQPCQTHTMHTSAGMNETRGHISRSHRATFACAAIIVFQSSTIDTYDTMLLGVRRFVWLSRT